jgi:hypothetical protein
MSITVQSLVDDIRVMSGLRGNTVLFSDSQIAELCNDAYDELRDIFAVSFAGWFKKQVTFTLNGGTGGNTFDLSTVTDLELVRYLDRALGNGFSEPVDMLGSVHDRNTGAPVPVATGRQYMVDGDTLTIVPPGLAQGTYTLTYQPQPETLVISSPGAGQRTDLPQLLTPWALFLKVHASIAIRTSRRQDTSELETKYQQQRARAVNMAKQRGEGVQQPPITRRRPVGGYWDGGGWGF